MKKRLVLVLMFIFALTTTAFAKEVTLDIYSVSDLHGQVLRTENSPGIAQLATFLKNKIGENKNRTLLLSGGDMSHNTIEGFLTQGAVVLESFNTMGFDASAIGNHEFYWGLESFKSQNKIAKFPMLAANFHSTNRKEKLSYIKPYIVLKKAGLKIGIIGISTLEASRVLPKTILNNLAFTPPTPVVQGIVDKLRQADVDIIILLTHLGSSQDEDGNISGDAADLVNTLTGVDAIISAHNHTPVVGIVNNAAIVQTSADGQAVGKINIVYNTDSDKIVRRNTEILSIAPDQYVDDPKIAAIVEKYQNTILPLKHKTLGKNLTTLDYNNNLSSPLGSWISDILRTHTQADFAFYNGSDLKSSLTDGDITYAKLFATIHNDNLVCTLEMTGEEIIRALELGLFNDHDLGALQFSGLKVLTDNTKWRGNRTLEVTQLDGSPLEMERLYRVATTDFLARGGDNLSVFTDSVNLELLSKSILDIIVEELAVNPSINFNMDDRLIDVNN